jgi:hypothetical protein
LFPREEKKEKERGQKENRERAKGEREARAPY